jgi:hypothetical protein
MEIQVLASYVRIEVQFATGGNLPWPALSGHAGGRHLRRAAETACPVCMPHPQDREAYVCHAMPAVACNFISGLQMLHCQPKMLAHKEHGHGFDNDEYSSMISWYNTLVWCTPYPPNREQVRLQMHEQALHKISCKVCGVMSQWMTPMAGWQQTQWLVCLRVFDTRCTAP